MTTKYINKFGLSWAINVFVWSNDPNDDADFLAYVIAALEGEDDSPNFEIRNAGIDRSGSPAQLHWEKWHFYNGSWSLYNSDTMPLSTGNVLYLARIADVIEIDPAGSWDSDEYGRPFDLNDLLA